MRIRNRNRIAVAWLLLGSAGCPQSDGGQALGPGPADAAADDGRADDGRAEGGAAGTPGDAADATDASSAGCRAEPLSPFGRNATFVCERCAPHGWCTSPDPALGECSCAREYTGARCERCADGYVEHQGRCVTPCQAAGLPCPGICTGTTAAPACECLIGYEGARCEQCSAGFEPDHRVLDALVCAPTCDNTCTPEETCTAPARDEQRCECLPGYARDALGACAWQGLLADPDFTQGCTHWQLFHVVASETDTVIAELAPGQLTLAVDHRCSTAGATAVAHPPARHTVPNPALAITATGIAGAALDVTFGRYTSPFPGQNGQPLAGTGERQRYIVCLPRDEGVEQSWLTLAVGEPGTCTEPLRASFTVHSLEVVSDDTCGS